MKEQVKEILCDILDIDDFEWADQLTPADFDDWDSMKNLRIITALEQEFAIQFSMSQIGDMQTLGKIIDTITELSA